MTNSCVCSPTQFYTPGYLPKQGDSLLGAQGGPSYSLFAPSSAGETECNEMLPEGLVLARKPSLAFVHFTQYLVISWDVCCFRCLELAILLLDLLLSPLHIKIGNIFFCWKVTKTYIFYYQVSLKLVNTISCVPIPSLPHDPTGIRLGFFTTFVKWFIFLFLHFLTWYLSWEMLGFLAALGLFLIYFFNSY